jgi:hypothetical protein
VSRAKVKLYAPPLIWSVLMLLMATQFWWASFDLAKREHWNFAGFCAVLVQTVMLYMGSSIVLPKVEPEKDTNLRAHYYREVRPVFTFGLLFLLIGFVRDWLIERSLDPATIGFMAFFMAVTLTGLVVRHARVHELIAPTMAIGITSFFAALFWWI